MSELYTIAAWLGVLGLVVFLLWVFIQCNNALSPGKIAVVGVVIAISSIDCVGLVATVRRIKP